MAHDVEEEGGEEDSEEDTKEPPAESYLHPDPSLVPQRLDEHCLVLDEVLGEVSRSSEGELVHIEAAEVVHYGGEDDVKAAVLGVEGVEEYVVFTDEVDIVDLNHLQDVLCPAEQVDVDGTGLLRLGEGEVGVWENLHCGISHG